MLEPDPGWGPRSLIARNRKPLYLKRIESGLVHPDRVQKILRLEPEKQKGKKSLQTHPKITLDYITRVLLQFMNERRLKQEFCDIILTVKSGGEPVHAHKAVLSATSPYFKKIFTNEKIKLKKIVLNEMNQETLRMLIESCYTSKISVDTWNVRNLLKWGYRLRLDRVTHCCCLFLKKEMEPETCLILRSLGKIYSRSALFDFADTYAKSHWNEIIKTPEFLWLRFQDLLEILFSFNPYEFKNRKEKSVLKGILIWIRYDLPQRRRNLKKLLNYVRIELLNPSYLVKTLATNLDTTSDDCWNFLREAKAEMINLIAHADDETKDQFSAESGLSESEWLDVDEFVSS